MTSSPKDLNLKTALSAIADLVMPRVCVVCGASLDGEEKHICRDCFADLPLTGFSKVEHNPMADKFNAGFSSDEYEPYAHAAALFYYSPESPYSRLTQALKYDGNIPAGRLLSRMLAEDLVSSPFFADVDAIVPVPLHWTRLLKRGYNQSGVIARCLASEMGVPELPGLLRRTRRTRSQTTLGMEEKALNVGGAFAVDTKTAGRTPAPRHILLVDDVFTSGSTLGACRAALKAHYGPGLRVSAATLAFVGRLG